MAERDVDVVVVGAGVAGLVAADRLVAAGKTVRVLEASGSWPNHGHSSARSGNVPKPTGRATGP